MSHNYIFQEPNITIAHHPDEDWIYVDWIGFQTTNSVKAGCELILEALRQEGLRKVLNDNTHVKGMWSGASEWVARDWFPRMRAAGMDWFAWIYSPSVFSQLSTDKTLNHTAEGFVKTFYELEPAQEWLRSLK